VPSDWQEIDHGQFDPTDDPPASGRCIWRYAEGSGQALTQIIVVQIFLVATEYREIFVIQVNADVRSDSNHFPLRVRNQVFILQLYYLPMIEPRSDHLPQLRFSVSCSPPRLK